MDISSAKTDIRARLLAARDRLGPVARDDADAALCRRLTDLLDELRPATLAGYVPVGAEPGGAVLVAALVASGARLMLPVLLPDADLDWARYEGPGSLLPAGRGLREPTGTRLGRDAIAAADVVVAPAVAVAADGLRLGRGGGSYDRALARRGPETLVVALLHDGELVTQLPAEAHDGMVDAVITPSGGFVRLPVPEVSLPEVWRPEWTTGGSVTHH